MFRNNEMTAHAQTQSVISRLVVVAAGICLSTNLGCQTQPTFIPGVGGSDFGTIAAPDGSNFRIIEQSDDTIRVEVDGAADGLVFTIDPDGMLTGIERPDGTNIDFVEQQNGTILVSGIGVFEGMQLPFSFTIDPAASSRGKGLAAASGDPLIVCLIIDAFCENLEALIAELLPPLIDAFIDANLPMIIEELGLKSLLDVFLIDVNELSFPTGFAQLDDPIRAEAQRQVEPMLAEVRNFCAHWQLLRLLEISVCDDLGS